MVQRRVKLEGIGEVLLRKQRQARCIRLAITHDGRVRLNLPTWVSYRSGLEFIRQKQDWIEKNRPINLPLEPNIRLGKAHTLVFKEGRSHGLPTAIVKNNLVIISLPKLMSYADAEAQRAAERGAIRALRLEAERLLPQRLKVLADKHGFTFASVTIKPLKSRWGSCDKHKAIVLNCFLVGLSWRLIDYVILHELTHTRILSHGSGFWSELGKYVNDLAAVREEMRSQRPRLITNIT